MSLAPEVAARVSTVFAAQGATRWQLSRSSAAERAVRLRRLRAAMVERREALAQAIHADFGKPAAEVEFTELHPSLEELDFALAHLPDWMASEVVPGTLLLGGTRSEIRREARGRVLILAPWNYPFYLTLPPLAAALAAGNAAIVKPSEKTPATSRFLASLLAAVFPENEVAVFEGGPEVAEALLELPFDHVFFTGSTAIGRKVMAAAAKTLASVTLELGGKSPAYVDRSANLSNAAEKLVFGRFVNAGQTCVAPDYVWVHEDLERPLIAALQKQIAACYGPSEEARRASPDFARVVDDQAFVRLEHLTRQTLAQGATAEVGAVFDRPTRYVAPTVLSGVGVDSPIMQEEIFGPVLPILRYRVLEETFAFIERQGKPLALYIFARDRRLVEEILGRTSSGGAGINTCVLHLANPHLPFGGVGASGLGSYHGFAGFKAFSHERSVLVQTLPVPLRLLLPPYGTKTLARRLLRWLE